MNRAQLQREREDLTLEMIPVDLRGILDGTQPDVPLQRNDVLYIPGIHDLSEEGILTIHGEVAHPGTFPFEKSMTIKDLVIKAGGLSESASMVHIDLTRRIKDPMDMTVSDSIGKNYTFAMNDGYLVDEGDFVLEPYDEIYIRRSPAYHAQQNVVVAGEVLFGGVTH
jgi:hypothetical protein